MPKYRKGKKMSQWTSNTADARAGKLRIVGGKFRGRLIDYSGDPVTRPMKDNTREALFNLVGGWVKGKAVFDLFAGTGAIGLEALSRGAARSIFVERHFPTVRMIKENVRSLGQDLLTEVNASDTFFWFRSFLNRPQDWPTEPWLVFCCPPYAFFEERLDDVLGLIEQAIEIAPPESIFVVESDTRFDPEKLPRPDSWIVRKYSPALVSVLRPTAQNDLD